MEAREAVLEDKLQSAQLRFADAVCRKQEGQNFGDILEQTTSIIGSLESSFLDAYPEGGEELAPAYIEGVKQALNKIRLDNGEDWEPAVSKFLQIEQKKLTTATSSIPELEAEPELPSIGPISYEIVVFRVLEKWKYKYGLGAEDHLMEIHLEDLYKFPEISVTPATLRKYFEGIGTYLETHPNIAAVIGESWLVDHPIGRKLGFQKITELDPEKNDWDTWSQLITQEGNVNEERLNQAIQKGKLPFQSTWGFIKREDFLRQYGIKREKGVSVEGAPA